MRSYPIKFAAATLLFVAINFCILLFGRGLIVAEYWIRELIIVKHDLASQMASPKIVLAGGSYPMFGIDALRIEREFHIPTLNFGLHAGMRLDWILRQTNLVVARGDTLILSLEPSYYRCESERWSDWQVRNALAWYFRTPPQSASAADLAAAFLAVGPELSLDYVRTAVKALGTAGREQIQRRLNALAPVPDVVARFHSGQRRTGAFEYSAYNVDERGSMLNTQSPGGGTGPASVFSLRGAICEVVKEKLRYFVAEWKGRGARVRFTYTPLITEDLPSGIDWQKEDALFIAEIEGLGSEVLGNQEELLYPRRLFLDTPFHLNEEGREINTRKLIAHLRLLGLAP